MLGGDPHSKDKQQEDKKKSESRSVFSQRRSYCGQRFLFPPRKKGTPLIRAIRVCHPCVQVECLLTSAWQTDKRDTVPIFALENGRLFALGLFKEQPDFAFVSSLVLSMSQFLEEEEKKAFIFLIVDKSKEEGN